MEKIRVHSQAELDAVPEDFYGKIYVEFGDEDSVVVIADHPNAHVEVSGDKKLSVRNTLMVKARGHCVAEVRGKVCFAAEGSCTVNAYENSLVKAYGSSTVTLYGNSYAIAQDNCKITAYNKTYVRAADNCEVFAYGTSRVDAKDTCSVNLFGNSSESILTYDTDVIYTDKRRPDRQKWVEEKKQWLEEKRTEKEFQKYASRNYLSMETVTVYSQLELDAVPESFKGTIYIEGGDEDYEIVVSKKYGGYVVARNNSYVEVINDCLVILWDTSTAYAYDNSHIVSWEDGHVLAYDISKVELYGTSRAMLYGESSASVNDKSEVTATEYATVEAWDDSLVRASDNSAVKAFDRSTIHLTGNAQAELNCTSLAKARERSYVLARDNSSVVAMDCVRIDACNFSTVFAGGMTTVTARDKCFIEAVQKAHVTDCGGAEEVHITGCATLVSPPKTIEEHCRLYNIRVKDDKGLFYKVVIKKKNGAYMSEYDNRFVYKIGETVSVPDFDLTGNDHGQGIYVTDIYETVRRYTRSPEVYAILELEVPLNELDVCVKGLDLKKEEQTYLHINTNSIRDGVDSYEGIEYAEKRTFRCKSAKIIREVPIEECGIYGSLISNMKTKRVIYEEEGK